MSKSILVFLIAGLHYFANGDTNRREHKVHNIVLYPERHSWCQTTPIKQIIAMPGYDPITIDNNVCVGACYSYSIPRTQPAEPGELIGPYCDSCQPKETQCYHVTLKSSSTSTTTATSIKSIQKRVQIISNCSCASCTRQQQRLDSRDCDLTDIHTSELPINLVSSLATNQEVQGQEVPELLTVGSAPISSNNSTTEDDPQQVLTYSERSYNIKPAIKEVLLEIQNSPDDFDNDRILMKQLLELVQGPDDKLTDKDVMEFVNYVNEHFDYDLDSLKLKSFLEKFRDEELKIRHRNFGLGPVSTFHDEEEDDEEEEEEDDVIQSPVITGIEGSHLHLGHKKGAHVAMGIIKSSNSIRDNEQEDKINKHHHHQVGDEQHLIGGSVAHLIMGPHGSLVAAPVEEKLDLETHEVAPNQEGAVIDYHHLAHSKHFHRHRDEERGKLQNEGEDRSDRK